jgi:tetratricopeptide (TPR) repeat protein
MEKPQSIDEYIARQSAAIAANPECGTSHYNLAIAYIGQKKYDDAEQELFEALECSPTLAEAYVQLGGICLAKGDLEGCLSFNQRAIHTRAGFAEGYSNIGFVYLQQGKADEAIAMLKKAINFNSNFIQAYTTLANAYLMKGLIDESIAANNKALSIEPKFAIAHNNLAIAYLEKKDFERAAHHCDMALELGYEVAPEIKAEIDKRK